MDLRRQFYREFILHAYIFKIIIEGTDEVVQYCYN